MRIKNKVAIVTGGASGMGKATAIALKNAGAKVAVFDRQKSDAEFFFECDVTDEKSITHAIQNVKKTLGVPQVCINCAGITSGERIVSKEGPMPLENFSKIINVNLVGTFNVMRLVAAEMMQANIEDEERGVIINTASIAAFEGQIGQAAYSASKGGVVAMMLPAAREFAKFSIRVMTIAPGLMDTPMMQGLPEDVQKALAESVPFPKRLGAPREYAQLVLHIIDNTMLNGEVIRLDGALRMAAK